MKRYLIVSGDFTPTGGMDRANHALARHLADLDAEVHLVGHRVSDDLRHHPNVRFHSVPRPLGMHLPGMPLLDRVGRFWARRIAADGGRVIVNGGNCSWGDVNWIHYVHAAWGTGWKRRLFLSHERRALTKARLVIANSERTRQDLIQRAGVPASRVRTVFYGVDSEAFKPPTTAERSTGRRAMGWPGEGATLAFIGGLGDRRKGFDTLFEAWRILSARDDWTARLAVMGVGANLNDWKTRAKQAGLRSIEFLGFRNDVPEVLKGCDALVSPTRYEAYGLGVHEALCCGMPALVSAEAGVAEVYSKEMQPLLIEDPDDAPRLAELLLHWSRHRQAYHAAAMALSPILRRRNWDCMGREIAAAIEESGSPVLPMKTAAAGNDVLKDRRTMRPETTAEAGRP